MSRTDLKAFVNGHILPQAEAVVSILDRGFLYGDGLFETLRCYRGAPFRWHAHLERLQAGARFLGIPLPIPAETLREAAHRLLADNQMTDAVLRLTVSRGSGPRGYSPNGAGPPTVTMTVHETSAMNHASPPAWNLVTSRIRLPAGETLALYKTCNKLPQILARAEADAAGADEALLLNTQGHIVEAATSNLFWIQDTTLLTAPLTAGVLPGVTRAVVCELAAPLGLNLREAIIQPADLLAADGLTLSSSVVGIARGQTLDGVPLRQSPWIPKLAHAYATLVDQETRGEPHP